MPRSRKSRTLAEIIGRGVSFESGEAIAIVQQLIAASALCGDAAAPVDPPSPDNIWLDSDGVVSSDACTPSPTVLEIGRLLQALLPHDGATRVPGALRYAIARALLEVEAPPFNSLAEFADALKRFERGDRSAVLQQLFARTPSHLFAVTAPVDAASRERRRREPSVRELRRQLREADEDRYRLVAERDDGSQRQVASRAAVEPISAISDPAPERASGDDRPRPVTAAIDRMGRDLWPAAIVGAVAAVCLSFAIGYFSVWQSGRQNTIIPVPGPAAVSEPLAPPAPSTVNLGADVGRRPAVTSGGVTDAAERAPASTATSGQINGRDRNRVRGRGRTPARENTTVRPTARSPR